jgi:ribosomal protein S18 acetylase RimI-like enzyme
MEIRAYTNSDYGKIIGLIAKFRVDLASYKSITREEDLSKAKEELDDYRSKNYYIWVAVNNKKDIKNPDDSLIGYIVCKIMDEVVVAESMYVLPEFRRNGIGSDLYQKAEDLCKEYQCETVYNWIHPNNEKIFKFLQKRGYSVLNLIEVRKKLSREKITKKIHLDNYTFDY